MYFILTVKIKREGPINGGSKNTLTVFLFGEFERLPISVGNCILL